MPLQQSYRLPESCPHAEAAELDAEEIAEIAAELAAGDELLDVIASLKDQEQADFDVALLRWYRGDAQAMETVRPLLAKHLDARAEAEWKKRRARNADEDAEAREWSRAA